MPKPFGNGLHRRGLEHGTQGQLRAKRTLGAGPRFDGQRGCPAKRKEVLVDTNARPIKYLTPNRSDLCLAIIARAPYLSLVLHLWLGSRKGLAVDLAVGIEREDIERYVRGGHHVGWQLGAGTGSQCVAVRITYPVRDEPRVGLALRIGKHQHFARPRHRAQDRFDFAEINTKPANLDLVIDAAKALEAAVFEQPCEVTGAVKSIPRRTERIRHEALSREIRTTVVAARKAFAPDEKLARHPWRNGLHGGIENVDRGSIDGATDRDANTTSG